MSLIGRIFGRGYDAGESSNVRSDLGWGRAVPCDEDHMIGPDRTRETSTLKAIDLFRNGQDNGVCDRIAMFALGSTGLRPQALTSDDQWNTLAEDWWNYTYCPTCDSRGRVSMWRMQWQAVSLRPTMGGVYWQLLSNGQIRPIETERIRNPKDEDARKNCFEGVKVDPATGLIQGYWVHTRDDRGGFSGNHKETFVPAANMIPVVAPPWRPDQVREMPDFARIVPRMKDMAEANHYTLNTMKTQSKAFGFLESLGGAGANSMPRGATRTVGERRRFQFDALEVMHLNQGEKMNLAASPTPGSNHIPYMQMQAGLAAAGINYPYEFYTYDFSKCDYSRMIAVVGLINRSSEIWQAWLAEALTKLWYWRIALAIRDSELPPAPVGDDGKSEWRMIDWQAPEAVSVDRQKEIQSDTLEFQMRQNSMSAIARRRGKDYEDVLRQQARDWKLEERVAQEEGVPSDLIHPKAQIPGQTSNAGPIGQEDNSDARE